MREETSTDKIKAAFEAAGHGSAVNWKRVSKKKGADGSLVRVFEHAIYDTMIEVTEAKDGTFTMRPFLEQKKLEIVNPEDTKQGFAPSIETDTEKNAAADKIIRIFIGDDEEAEEDPDGYSVSKELLDKAGKALLNRYYFAISKEDEEDYAGIVFVVNPMRSFEEERDCSYQRWDIEELMPRCSELTDSTWELHSSDIKTTLQAVEYLSGLGLIWDKKFQDSIDPSVTAEISKAVGAAKKTSKPNSKKPGI